KLIRAADGLEVALDLPPEEAKKPKSFLRERWGNIGITGITLARASRAPVFAVISSEAAYVYDVAKFKLGDSMQPSRIALDPREISLAAALSDNGRRLAVVRSSVDGTNLQSWRQFDAVLPRFSPKYLPSLKITSQLLSVTSIAAMTDAVVVTASKFDMQAWDLATGEVVARIPGVEGINGLRCDPHGTVRCYVSHSRGAATFNVFAPSPLFAIDSTRPASARTAVLGTTPESKTVFASAASRQLILGYTATPEEEFRYPLELKAGMRPKFFSADGRLLYLDGGESPNHVVARIDWGSTPPSVTVGPSSKGEDNVVFSSNSRYIARKYDTRVEVTNTNSGAVHTHNFPSLDSFAISDSGLLAAVVPKETDSQGLAFPELRVVGIEDSKTKALGSSAADITVITSVNFSSTGRFLLVGSVNALRVIDLEARSESEIPFDNFSVLKARLDGNGKYAVVIGRSVGRLRPSQIEVRIAEVASREEVARGTFRLQNHDQVAMEPDGTRVRMPVYQAGQLHIARWLWAPETLLAESCKHLQGQFPQDIFLKLTASAAKTVVPCPEPFFSR
ncbi:MAG: hypothetical protein AABZ67_06410, partial [Pseudomonadota bacterium]